MNSMIKKLLIANRGEIAVRIISTCRKMGIAAVAVYSEADRGGRYVAMADEAHFIGAPEAHASYLAGDKIISLALRVGADAIHPGYGFLAENGEFATRCESAGVLLVGPPAELIKLMGSKIESKRIATDCEVPTVPGYFGEQQDPGLLRAKAADIGTPLVIKASAGGGGRGMRIVTQLSDFETQLELVMREAQAAFGDRRVLLEKYIAEPRHLEVQVLGDNHGNLLHLFERECSIQRNHQKLIEEAPAAYLEDDLRETLYAHALKLSNHIAYRSAGTVEFLLDDTTGELYFLEMNTRLQVEHPVTELICGVDLVEWQIRVAAGEPLTMGQDDLVASGWAMEARVTAEDPASNYRPEVGRLEFYLEPGGAGVRVDSGVSQGSEVSPYYDSLLAKVIAWGDTREQARFRLLQALRDYVLAGVGNNIAFLSDLLRHPAFLSRPLTTHYIARQFPEGWQPDSEPVERLLVTVALVWSEYGGATDRFQKAPWHQLKSWRLLRNAGHRPRQSLVIRDADGKAHNLEIGSAAGSYQITLEGHATSAGEPVISDGEVAVEIDGELVRYLVKLEDRRVILGRGAVSHIFEIVTQGKALAGESDAELTGEGSVRAPMPGSIQHIRISVGDRVERGDVLMTLEAMKLMHNLPSGVSGTVLAIHCGEGENVEANALLLEIATDED
jgi:3-methylcrotonyl-CoA carboxylase alpha subunit